MSRADTLLAGMRAYLEAARLFAADHDGQADTAALADAAHYADQLDAHLSGDGQPPAAWAPEHTGLHEEIAVVWHPSRVIPGALNLELDAPAGQRIRLHVNDGLAFDMVVPDTRLDHAACVACGLGYLDNPTDGDPFPELTTNPEETRQ